MPVVSTAPPLDLTLHAHAIVGLAHRALRRTVRKIGATRLPDRSTARVEGVGVSTAHGIRVADRGVGRRPVRPWTLDRVGVDLDAGRVGDPIQPLHVERLRAALGPATGTA